jgi:hypothetical protein
MIFFLRKSGKYRAQSVNTKLNYIVIFFQNFPKFSNFETILVNQNTERPLDYGLMHKTQKNQSQVKLWLFGKFPHFLFYKFWKIVNYKLQK